MAIEHKNEGAKRFEEEKFEKFYNTNKYDLFRREMFNKNKEGSFSEKVQNENEPSKATKSADEKTR